MGRQLVKLLRIVHRLACASRIEIVRCFQHFLLISADQVAQQVIDGIAASVQFTHKTIFHRTSKVIERLGCTTILTLEVPFNAPAIPGEGDQPESAPRRHTQKTPAVRERVLSLIPRDRTADGGGVR